MYSCPHTPEDLAKRFTPWLSSRFRVDQWKAAMPLTDAETTRLHRIQDLVKKQLHITSLEVVKPLEIHLGIQGVSHFLHRRSENDDSGCAESVLDADLPVNRFWRGLACCFAATRWPTLETGMVIKESFAGEICSALNRIANSIDKELREIFGERNFQPLDQDTAQEFLESLLGENLRFALGIVVDTLDLNPNNTPIAQSRSFGYSGFALTRFRINNFERENRRLEKENCSLKREIAEYDREFGEMHRIQKSLRRQLQGQKKKHEALLAELTETRIELQRAVVEAERLRSDLPLPAVSEIDLSDAEIDRLFEDVPHFESGKRRNPIDHIRIHYGRWLCLFGALVDQVCEEWISKYDPTLIHCARQKISQDKRRKGACTIETPSGPIRIAFLRDLIPPEKPSYSPLDGNYLIPELPESA